MYSFGSVVAVGSWFCISVTSKLRKSLAEIVAEPALLGVVVAVALVLVSGEGPAPCQITEDAAIVPPMVCLLRTSHARARTNAREWIMRSPKRYAPFPVQSLEGAQFFLSPRVAKTFRCVGSRRFPLSFHAAPIRGAGHSRSSSSVRPAASQFLHEPAPLVEPKSSC